MLRSRALSSDDLYVYRAAVRSVYDGDTLRADIDLGFGHFWKGEQGKGVKIRLWGIDTPEVRGPDRPIGLEVRTAVREVLPVGSLFYLQTVKDKTGTFGRYLGEVWPIGWDESVNEWLLRTKQAKEYGL